jgi:hypothetical protein
MRRNQIKSGISRTSTHHRRMKNIRILKETKSQVNNLIYFPTGFDRRNIKADRTSKHSTYSADYEVIMIFQCKIVTYYRTKTIKFLSD